MKKLLLFGLIIMSQLSLASSLTPEETAETLCNARKVGRGYVKSVNRSFDFKKCIEEGAQAYSEGKLALAKKTCFSFEQHHAVGQNSTIKCVEILDAMDMPYAEEFNNALTRCSKLEDDGKVRLSTYLYNTQRNRIVRNTTYSCMKLLF